MHGAALRSARQARGWTQAELADRLNVTQAYVCLLERGRRPVSPRLLEKLVTLLELPASVLPLTSGSRPLKADEVPGTLAAFGYPGFAHLKGHRPQNPAAFLLRVLRAPDVDARVVDGLPWLLLRYPELDWPWLVREAKANDLQNRLGFLVGLARELAELRGADHTAAVLAAQEQALEGSRLQRQDAFRAAMTDAERRWLLANRPAQAAHWNVLSTLTAGELAGAY